jgi:hypothetical protein
MEGVQMSEETEIKMFPMNHPISNPTTQIMRVDLDGGFTVNESIPATDAAKMVLGLMKQEWLADAQCAKIRELQSDVTQLENRLRALWDKLEWERKYYMEQVRRLEEAGNNLLWNFCPEYTSDFTASQSDALKQWNKAKDVTP